MKIGRFTIEQLSEGQFEFFPDGTINRRPIDEETDDISELVSKSSSELIGINPVYVTDEKHHILLDTGLGWGLDAGSAYEDVSNIKTNLSIFDVTPADITHVVLSHLHYEHAAGSSYTDVNQTIRPTFPNARYFLQKPEWEYAVEQVQNNSAYSNLYKLDDLYRIYVDAHFEMVQEKQLEIIPGITLIRTEGHTAGHQIVKITDNAEVGYFLGDLIATEKQLNHFSVSAGHMDRMQTKRWKVQLLKKAFQEKAVLFFYHSLFSSAGRLKKDKDEQYVLKKL